jgi:uncharacterized protein (DUF58 family)
MTNPAPELGESIATRELLRRLQLDIRMRLDGMLHGDYRGLVPGHGSELGETRQYAPGDDVRRIDWNVTARLQTPHVRESIADRELETTLLIDLSPSLDFGTTHQEKRDLVVSAVGAIGLLTARVGNRLGAILLEPDGPTDIPSRQGDSHLLSILHRLANTPRRDRGTVDLTQGLHRVAARTRRRGLIVVVSDFLAPPGWQKPMRKLVTRHDVLAIEVIDPREMELPDVGIIALTDPETGAIREVDTRRASTRNAYADAAFAQRIGIVDDLVDVGADHLQLHTDRDWLVDLAEYVLRRRRHRGAVRRSS